MHLADFDEQGRLYGCDRSFDMRIGRRSDAEFWINHHFGAHPGTAEGSGARGAAGSRETGG
ncbi:MAG: hypothetical protein WCC24_20260, partial [Terracidiphilus sp.]